MKKTYTFMFLGTLMPFTLMSMGFSSFLVGSSSSSISEEVTVAAGNYIEFEEAVTSVSIIPPTICQDGFVNDGVLESTSVLYFQVTINATVWREKIGLSDLAFDINVTEINDSNIDFLNSSTTATISRATSTTSTASSSLINASLSNSSASAGGFSTTFNGGTVAQDTTTYILGYTFTIDVSNVAGSDFKANVYDVISSLTVKFRFELTL